MSSEPKNANRDELVESHVKEAREQLAGFKRHIKDLAERNHALTEPADDEYLFKGQFGIRGIFVFTNVDGYALVGSTRLNFSGRAWGPTVITGEYFGGGTLVI